MSKVVIDTSVFFPSDVFSLQWPSGLVQTISPKIFPAIKQDHQHDKCSSAKHAMNQKPLSLGAIIDMVISTLDKYYLGLQINRLSLVSVPKITTEYEGLQTLYIKHCLI
ncbi:hypothetical protein PHYBLDRAFT_162426 [Phycomyces blakesleeanus NRRL 1555(-)]|uniref:Uncharacterized protein n=1 Tax=Phycomyces blakesleeanus (strain ATCC 8743b / DSM 1359 / FGSC 10004 / NBRC 33097 / NRRL 1555) TaxID=763407 RepID=A0A162V1E2_PHYB8|nr:hypothetical protein PHYBLDRAFT_162426 [Phycomyces blakesleeanus NRRL 1555(-)]OAD79352.1 hypothetical protein PHYBLDRAFT_162426 [Phycomyces blakesleeanus NRRL 1555(-)]|eukprot:XP_018297392.1 hypothetical protein PHYBLDRAFT_162426 [Phycomyces blakesleeanus NRRL 1555(-)]